MRSLASCNPSLELVPTSNDCDIHTVVFIVECVNFVCFIPEICQICEESAVDMCLWRLLLPDDKRG